MHRRRAGSFAKLLFGLPGFVRRPISFDEARAKVRAQLDAREANFLHMVRRLIYGYERSPYLPLLRDAGCELGDLERSVAGKGVEATLLDLRRAGVYVAFEEFKGRQPLVRGSRALDVGPSDFDNPSRLGGLQVSTGGSTGAGVPVWLSLPYLADRGTSMMLGFEAHGVLGAPSAGLREAPPAPSVGLMLEDAYVGQVHERWFAPSLDEPPFSLRRNRLAIDLIARAARLGGVKLPRPEPIELDRLDPLVRWTEARLRSHGKAMIRTGISYAMRTCLAAQAHGVDLEGVTFVGAGEPVTRGKVDAIERSRARWLTNYTVSEAGRIGIGCTHPADETDVHLLAHAVALVQHERDVPEWGGSVQSFHLTSLLPTAPKVLLNVETDDHGIVEERSCGCPLEVIGFRHHIREIFSFRKLTGEGVTLLGADALRIIDHVLPSRFGGTPADYQLAEEEDGRGFTRVCIVVDPRIELPEDAVVIDAVLDGLRSSSDGAGVGSIWRTAGALRVQREDPQTTGRGKLRPIVSRRPASPDA